MKKKSLNNIIKLILITGAVIAVCAFILHPPFRDSILLYILYKPAYFLSDSIYLPFYFLCLNQFDLAIGLTFILLILSCFNKLINNRFFIKNKYVLILSAIIYTISITGFFASGYFNDVIEITKNAYSTDQYKLYGTGNYDIKSGPKSRNYYYRLWIYGKNSSEMERFALDYVHYREMKNIKLENYQLIKIYYLPHTRCLLKYELINENN